MSISKKLYRSFGWILLSVVLLFAVNIVAVWYEHHTRETANRSAEMVQAVSDFDHARMQARILLSNYILSGLSKDADALDRLKPDISGLIDTAEEKAGTLAISLGQEKNDRPRMLLEQLRGLEDKWNKGFAEPMVEERKKLNTGATKGYSNLFNTYLARDSNLAHDLDKLESNEGAALKDPLKELQEWVQSSRDTTKASSDRASNIAWGITLVGLVVIILAGVIIARTSARAITSPLQQLISVSSQIANSGDLDQKVEIYSNDEIGELAATFNRMVEYLREMASISEAIAGGDLSAEINPRSPRDTLGNAFHEMTIGLRSLVKNVRDSAAQVASGSSQVASASDDSAKISVQAASAIDEVTSTMHEMSINVQNMVKSTQLQSSNVSETSASIDEMVASIQRVADTAKVLLDISQRSRDEVHSGINTMQKATDGLNRINSSISSSAEIISVLGQRADDIGKIIEVIDDLAEQTNLLALNAAIEAARAGEHGLGFAVVADEVRKLAEKSAQSTREISDLIQSIQKEARKAVENMEKSTTIVNEGLTLGGDLSAALKKISNVVAEVYKFAQEIGAATNEQSHGSSQIAKATTRLNEITHEINSSVEEQASGAQAVVKAMEKMRELVQRSSSGSTELAASSEQMSKMARTMLESMDRFVFDLHQNGNGRNGSAKYDGPQPPKRGGPARFVPSSPAYN